MKAKTSGPADDRRSDFFEKCTNLKQPYCFFKVHFQRSFDRDTIVLLRHGLHEYVFI